jgi:NhaA family Na+:H+ antiporter
VLGKPLGIILVTWLLVRVGFAKLPRHVTWDQIVAVGIMGGMGFTMSILIAGLAFSSPQEVMAAKCAILAGSFCAGALGVAYVHLDGHFRSKKLGGEKGGDAAEAAPDGSGGAGE